MTAESNQESWGNSCCMRCSRSPQPVVMQSRKAATQEHSCLVTCPAGTEGTTGARGGGPALEGLPKAAAALAHPTVSPRLLQKPAFGHSNECRPQERCWTVNQSNWIMTTTFPLFHISRPRLKSTWCSGFIFVIRMWKWGGKTQTLTLKPNRESKKVNDLTEGKLLNSILTKKRFFFPECLWLAIKVHHSSLKNREVCNLH